MAATLNYEYVLAGTNTGGLPESIQADKAGVDIDVRGAHKVLLLAYVGAIGGGTVGASDYWTLKVQQAPESSVTPDTPGTYRAVPDSQLARAAGFVAASANDGSFAIVDATDEDEVLYAVEVEPTGAYLRFYADETGSVGATTFTVAAVVLGTYQPPA